MGPNSGFTGLFDFIRALPEDKSSGLGGLCAIPEHDRPSYAWILVIKGSSLHEKVERESTKHFPMNDLDEVVEFFQRSSNALLSESLDSELSN